MVATVAFALSLLSSPQPCQADAAAMAMVQRALAATEQVQDYSATVAVTVASPDVNIPRRTAKVYFKRPDKVHVESEGLMVIPRDALMLGNLGSYVEQYATASFIGSGTLSGRPVRAIKLSPRDPRPADGRLLVWIDSERHLLLKSEVWRAGNHMLTAKFEHTRVDQRYWMPRRIVTEMKAGALSRRAEAGRVELVFSDYRVNRGIPDSVFEGTN